MGRPKASDRKTRIALEFANAITVECLPHTFFIDCSGPHSIFKVLKACLPQVAREAKQEHQIRDAVSEVELNKLLARAGYVSYRKKFRIKGIADKWAKGVKFWSNRRWIDPANQGDLNQLTRRLGQMKASYTEIEDVTLQSLLALLASLCSKCSKMPLDAQTGSEASDSSANHRAGRSAHSSSAKIRKIALSSFSPALLKAQKLGWAYQPLINVWTCGYRTEPWVDILDKLPAAFKATVRAYLNSIEIILSERRCLAETLNVAGTSFLSVTDAALRKHVEKQLLNLFEQDSDFGVMQLLIDATNQKVTHVFVNTCWALKANMPKDTILDRFSKHSVPLPFLESDYLLILLVDLLRYFESETTIYTRAVFGSDSARYFALICLSSSKKFDAYGQVTQVSQCFRTITQSDYDEATAHCPGDCPLYLMGDRRHGQRLLDEAHTDSLFKIAHLESSPCPVHIADAASIFVTLATPLMQRTMYSYEDQPQAQYFYSNHAGSS